MIFDTLCVDVIVHFSCAPGPLSILSLYLHLSHKAGTHSVETPAPSQSMLANPQKKSFMPLSQRRAHHDHNRPTSGQGESIGSIDHHQASVRDCFLRPDQK
jgi:hypothetical protein